MPHFTRYPDHYAYTPKNGRRKYILKKDDQGKWVAEAYRLQEGKPTDLRMMHSQIPQKRQASELVDYWITKGL
jgi:hypothetical protein